MTSLLLSTALLVAMPAAAQTMPAPVATPSATATPSASATPAKTARYTLDTPIETIVADPAGKAVIDKDLPGVTTHPLYDQFKAMSLAQVQPMSQGALSDAALARVTADLAALK